MDIQELLDKTNKSVIEDVAEVLGESYINTYQILHNRPGHKLHGKAVAILKKIVSDRRASIDSTKDLIDSI